MSESTAVALASNNGTANLTLPPIDETVDLPPVPMDAEIEARIADRVRDCEGSIRSYYNYITEQREKIDKAPALAIKLFTWKRALETAGYDVRMSNWVDQLWVKVKQSDLPALARILGPMPETNRNVTEDDVANVGLEERQAAAKAAGRRQPSKKYMAAVECTPKRHDFISVQFNVPVKQGKCKIKTVVTRRKELVCDVG